MWHVSLIRKNGCKTDFTVQKEKQSKKKYLTGTIWEEISVDLTPPKLLVYVLCQDTFQYKPDPLVLKQPLAFI